MFRKTEQQGSQEEINSLGQLKSRLEQIQKDKIAVLSVQSLDNQKIALRPGDLGDYAQQNPGVFNSGDGHTGFAMAMALNAPFVVMRSEENLHKSSEILKPCIGDNGLIVVTGHSAPGGDMIKGAYNYTGSEENDLYKQQIEREPKEIVNLTMDAGLKRGNHITIMLCICYGALSTNESDSFTHKLAWEFAARGVSSTIIASVKPVHRFGTSAIFNEKIMFNEQRGMAAKDIWIFNTELDGPDSHPQVDIWNLGDAVQLTKNGIEFLKLNQQPVVSVINKPLVEPNGDPLFFIEKQFKEMEKRLHEQHEKKIAQAKQNYQKKTNNVSSPSAAKTTSFFLPQVVFSNRQIDSDQPVKKSVEICNNSKTY
jgi:hypothetical protein